MTLRGVIFDLDGTLYRMLWYMKPLFFARLFPHGFRLPAYMKVREEYAGVDHGSGERLMRLLSASLSARARISDAESAAWIQHSFYPGFVAMMRVVRNTRPCVEQMLERLRRDRVRTAVLSDFARVPERLASLGIPSGLFDTLASSESAGALKPSPRPFLDIAEGWGVEPSEVLVVGDRDDTDGEGARRAGMQFALLSGRPCADWDWLQARFDSGSGADRTVRTTSSG